MFLVLLLLAKEVAEINVENQNNFADRHETCVKTQLNCKETCVFNHEFLATEVKDHVGIVVAVETKVYEHVANQP